jgi:hypothetical protein
VPGVADREQDAARVAAPQQIVGQAAERASGRDEQGHQAGRQQEQHRHEHELRGHGEPVADREAHPRRQRVAEDQAQRQRQVDLVLGRQDERHDRRRGDQRHRRDCFNGQLAPSQRLRRASVELLEELFDRRSQPCA